MASLDKGKWLEIGIQEGWISLPYCETHDEGYPTDEERAEWEEMGDPCIVVGRLYVKLADMPDPSAIPDLMEQVRS